MLVLNDKSVVSGAEAAFPHTLIGGMEGNNTQTHTHQLNENQSRFSIGNHSFISVNNHQATVWIHILIYRIGCFVVGMYEPLGSEMEKKNCLRI